MTEMARRLNRIGKCSEPAHACLRPVHQHT
jgi:hypothetical protein